MGNSKQSGKRSLSYDLFGKVCLAIALCVAVSAEAAAQTVTYSVAGVQTAVSDTSSSFVGVAFGTDGNLAWWQADVDRTPLDPQPAFVTGGTFQLDGHLSDIVGTFTNGGFIIRESTSSCRRETFAVTGFLDLDGGEGFYDLTLTHYRLRIGAQCITYFATVEGLVAFTFDVPPPQ